MRPAVDKKSELILMGARQHQFNFVRRLSWSISSIFKRKFTLKCASQPKIAKNSLKTHIFLEFKVIDFGTPEKLVGSTCYDKQQVCVCLQRFSR